MKLKIKKTSKTFLIIVSDVEKSPWVARLIEGKPGMTYGYDFRGVSRRPSDLNAADDEFVATIPLDADDYFKIGLPKAGRTQQLFIHVHDGQCIKASADEVNRHFETSDQGSVALEMDDDDFDDLPF